MQIATNICNQREPTQKGTYSHRLKLIQRTRLYPMLCKPMQCNAVQCRAMQCNSTQYNAMQYNAIQYNTNTYLFANRRCRIYACGWWLWELTTRRSALEWLVLQSGTARVVPAVARPLAAAPAGTTSAVPDCSTNHDSADRISGQYLFYHDHNFTKSKGNLRFRRLVPLFVPIGVCVTTHDDGTASDVTIGLWRHNQQATNHERNGKPWFSLPK